MCQYICNFLKRNNRCFLLLSLCVLLLILIIVSFSYKEKTIENVYYIISVILAFLLLLVAYSNLKGIKKSINSKFLYEIDQRWGDDKILKARSILHKFILESKFNNQKDYVSHKIISYYKSSFHTEETILIVNFLEFMETMGYLIYKEKTITEEQVKNLCGYEVLLFYPIYEDLITLMRKIYNNKDLFENFQEMHKRIK